MEWKKVKTILIFVLLGVNVFLLANYLSLLYGNRETEENALVNALSVLSDSGISISREIIPAQKQSAAYEGTRSAGAEEAAAVRFTGSSKPETPGGGIVGYSSPTGTIVFRTGGAITAQMTKIETPETEKEAWTFLESLFKEAGFDILGSSHTEKTEDGKLTVECTQKLFSLDVFNGRLKAVFSPGTLNVSGKWAFVSGLSKTSDTVKPTIDLLLSLKKCIQQAKIGSAAVTFIADGYLITAPSADKIGLTPVWEIAISGEKYYLDKVRGIFILAS